MTKTFTRNEIEEMYWTDYPELVEKTFLRQARWHLWFRIVFRDEDGLWAVEFNEPATEMQEADWPEEFEAVRVEPQPTTITQYVPAAVTAEDYV